MLAHAQKETAFVTIPSADLYRYLKGTLYILAL